MSDNIQATTSNRQLSKNVLWHFSAQMIPLVVGLVTIPLIIEKLGVSRFGILTLSWVIVGYFSIFDFGLGRALTHFVSRALSENDEEAIPQIFTTAMVIMGAFGLALGILGYVSANDMVTKVFSIEPQLQAEAEAAFRIISLAIPLVILSTGVCGLLEARQRFDQILMVRIPLGVTNYLGPLLVIWWANDLAMIVLLLVAARFIAFLCYGALCFRLYSFNIISLKFDAKRLPHLFNFGVWITVANTIGPVMLYADRFLIGTVLSMTALAYYATPFDVIYRLAIIPNAFVGVLFPAFSSLSRHHGERVHRLFWSASKAIFLIVFPIVFIIIVFAREGLQFWLGPEFAANSTLILQILALGILVNSNSRVGTTLIQGSGRPDISARILLFELPIYVCILWLLLEKFGLIGAAIAWSIRALSDAILVQWYARRMLHTAGSLIESKVFIFIGVAICLPFIGSQLPGGIEKVAFSGICLAFFLGLSWQQVLTADERAIFQTAISRFRNSFEGK